LGGGKKVTDLTHADLESIDLTKLSSVDQAQYLMALHLAKNQPKNIASKTLTNGTLPENDPTADHRAKIDWKDILSRGEQF
jgi:hypothetical protein